MRQRKQRHLEKGAGLSAARTIPPGRVRVGPRGGGDWAHMAGGRAEWGGLLGPGPQGPTHPACTRGGGQRPQGNPLWCARATCVLHARTASLGRPYRISHFWKPTLHGRGAPCSTTACPTRAAGRRSACPCHSAQACPGRRPRTAPHPTSLAHAPVAPARPRTFLGFAIPHRISLPFWAWTSCLKRTR